MFEDAAFPMGVECFSSAVVPVSRHAVPAHVRVVHPTYGDSLGPEACSRNVDYVSHLLRGLSSVSPVTTST